VDEDRNHEAWVAALVQALEAGTVLDLAPGEDLDLTQAARWPESRQLPGDALRAALLTPGVLPGPRGLRIRAAYVSGLADLADLRLTYGLSFDSCAFEQPADWQRLTVAHLHLTHCLMPALSLDGVHIDGDLGLAGLTAPEVIANGANISGDLDLTNATLTNEGGIALALDRAQVKGNAVLTRLSVTGQLWANGAIIGWQLDLKEAKLTNEGGDALNLDGADVKGGAFLNSVAVTGVVRAISATFGGELNLTNATLTNAGGIALNLDRAQVKGNAVLTRLSVTGQLWANGAMIRNQLNLREARLANEGGIALNLDSAEINGRVVLDSINVSGEVWALDASFGSDLFLESALLTNYGGDALSLDRAVVKGGAFLNRVAATGTVRAPGATIGGKLDLTDAELFNDGGIALNLDGADIKGRVLLDSSHVIGEVRALAATFGGELSLRDAELTNKQGAALNLQSARIGHFRLIPATVTGIINLDSAQLTVLEAPNDMTVLYGSQLSASGWRLGDVRGRIQRDRVAAFAWLSRRPSPQEGSPRGEFVAQPLHELADVYDRNGQPAAARWMRRKAQEVTRTSPFGRIYGALYGALIGHGYLPLLSAVWLIVAIVASGVIVATNEEVFTPTATNKAAWKIPPPDGQPVAPITGATPCEDLQDPSSCLKPGLYALDNALPGTVATGQAAQWSASGAQGLDVWIPYVIIGLRIASWILVALFLAGVTGLIRKT
jgi:hypothetical protein